MLLPQLLCFDNDPFSWGVYTPLVLSSLVPEPEIQTGWRNSCRLRVANCQSRITSQEPRVTEDESRATALGAGIAFRIPPARYNRRAHGISANPERH
jgi:hypothetical protein